ncbi:hypothetical protein EIP86_008152 [Pleurotus ostreatoroseus]|nr:hypothetical protein EIP86_008152 [Pleurotus ostreatoroseus]
MLGVEGYGSGSDSDNDDGVQQRPSTSTASASSSKSSLLSKLSPAKKSGLSLPPPSSASANASASKASTGLNLPAPKKKGPKKITIGLPSLPAASEDADDLDDRPAKKPRVEQGAGASALLSMLPAPKNKNPTPAQAERVLGGGRGPGLVFHAKRSTQQATVEDVEEDEDADAPANVAPMSNSILEEVAEAEQAPKPSTASSALPFLPPHLKRGKANISTEEKFTLPKGAAAAARSAAPAVDFFSLGSSSSTPTLPTPTSANPSALPFVSSAPVVDEFTPPEPTPQDPYPGYYLLPSGTWAAYDPAYYQKFYKKWKKDYDDHVRALEKGVEKGFEAVEREGAQEVDAAKEMERAKVEIQEREEKKALTAGDQGERAAPKMNIKGAALSGRAKGRHQLTTLLSEAYANREALEERIAQGRRNRKEAGNKYGF